MRDAASNAYLSIEDFSKAISSASNSTRVLGATNFSKIFKNVTDIAKKSNYYGATSQQEFIDVATSYIDSVGNSGRLQGLSNEQATNATLQLVQTNSGLAKLMGMNREDLNKQLAAANVDKDFSLILAEKYNGGVRQKEIENQLALMPEEMKKLMKEFIITGGNVLTQESAQYAAMNPATANLLRKTALDLTDTNKSVNDTMASLGDKGRVAVAKDVGGLQGATQRGILVNTGITPSYAESGEFLRKLNEKQKIEAGLIRDNTPNKDAISGLFETGEFKLAEAKAVYDKFITNTMKPFGDALTKISNSTSLSFSDLTTAANDLTGQFKYLGLVVGGIGLLVATSLGSVLVKALMGAVGLIGTTIAGAFGVGGHIAKMLSTGASTGLAAGAGKVASKGASAGLAARGASILPKAGMLVRGGGAVLAGLAGLASSPVLATLATIAAGAWAVSEIMDTTDKYTKQQKKPTSEFLPNNTNTTIPQPDNQTITNDDLLQQQKITNEQLKKLNDLMNKQTDIHLNNLMSTNENLVNLLKTTKGNTQAVLSINGF